MNLSLLGGTKVFRVVPAFLQAGDVQIIQHGIHGALFVRPARTLSQPRWCINALLYRCRLSPHREPQPYPFSSQPAPHSKQPFSSSLWLLYQPPCPLLRVGTSLELRSIVAKPPLGWHSWIGSTWRPPNLCQTGRYTDAARTAAGKELSPLHATQPSTPAPTYRSQTPRKPQTSTYPPPQTNLTT
mmetsp:Transcript_16559/g.29314  ORF Transcript_16559/g.29314 Transcript_16559/m.29314 type:complete len:185 (+) Transcript_16559:2734-3288(+)